MSIVDYDRYISIPAFFRDRCSDHSRFLHTSHQLEKSSGTAVYMAINMLMTRSSTTLSAQGTQSLIFESSKPARVLCRNGFSTATFC